MKLSYSPVYSDTLHLYSAYVFRQSDEGKAAEQPHPMSYANRLAEETARGGDIDAGNDG